ncbi:superfamily I DNA/RNA helicase [Microbacterium sp. AK009]|uniref:PD-(D/E)XK nuclease family protein n=1 Tax=Microbacterium sp. AK009 TaxID=2723068 RepID=UPI00184475B5|nr:PD-(D/E)XK nuclease family protein [Microbacterium sp. AK009]NYF17303.1 superfamily I DNA/RNA helicase [Microbacterium sp. AK009]
MTSTDLPALLPGPGDVRVDGGAAPLLDADQSAVVGLPAEASGVVVGAPGSGKTRAVIERFRRLVDEGSDPDEVLVLTPTRQTATLLRDRLSLAAGRATSGAPARSVPSFAFQIVRAAEVASGGEAPQLLTGGDDDQLLRDLLDGDADDEAAGRPRGWPEWLGPEIRATAGFRTEVRTFLAECTTLGVEPAALDRLASTHEVEVWHPLASFFREYLDVRAAMRGAHRDAAGLVREAVGIVRGARDTGAARAAVGGVRVLLVDDAQELTLGAIELLEACAARGVAVLAFGDPDVGAGAFRGASPENFARLAASLKTVHVLGEGHRGTRAQRETVRRIVERIGAVGVVAHRRAPDPTAQDSSVRALVLRSAAEEFDAVARILRERHLLDGVPWHELAVIAHDSRQVAALEAELGAREVPARSQGAGRALGEVRAVRDILRLVELAHQPVEEWTADDVSAALEGVCGRLDPIELRRLRTGLRHREIADGGDRSGRDLLLSAMIRPLEWELVDTREARRAAVLADTLVRLREQVSQKATVHELLWTAWERSRLERAWVEQAKGHGPLADQAGRDLDAMVALFQAAKRFVERSIDGDARAFIRGILDSAVADDRLDAALPHDVVAVLTPAAALGLDVDTVVVAGVQDGVWPNTRHRGSLLETWRLADAAQHRGGSGPGAAGLDRRRAALHDELRLFARALSRARSRTVVTAVDDDDRGPSAFFDLLPDPEVPTASSAHPLSLRGVVALHRRVLTTPDALADAAGARAAAGQLALLAAAEVPGASPEEWYGVRPPTSSGPLRDLARERVRVSPSRLHTLEECELNWLIGELGGDPGSTTAGVGTIIHAALEVATAGTDEDTLWEVVERRWHELVFDASWQGRAERARARDLVRRLARYLDRFDADGGRLLDAEPHFEIPLILDPADPAGLVVGGSSDGSVADAAKAHAVLSGYIDRVELLADGSVVIVDLKTGKSEPQTDAKVIDHPQLAAYQLAFEAGSIPGTAGRPSGGARLLVLRPTSQKEFVTPTQPPFDDDRRAGFLSRVHAAITVMTGESFHAPYEEHCRDEHSHGLCRIHTIGAVSAS